MNLQLTPWGYKAFRDLHGRLTMAASCCQAWYNDFCAEQLSNFITRLTAASVLENFTQKEKAMPGLLIAFHGALGKRHEVN